MTSSDDRPTHEYLEASNPMSFNHPYESGMTVFGEAVSADFLVSRIRSYDWRESFVRLAHMASVLANDERGPMSSRALRLTAEGLGALSGSAPEARAMLERGRQYALSAKRPLIIAHEEALVFLEHLVLLHGAEGGQCPGDAELCLWLLGASDHLDAWLEPDARELDPTDSLAAELVKVFRFNRSSVDEVRLILRAQGLFGKPPTNGPFATAAAWDELQNLAFGAPFSVYHERFAIPLTMLSHSWARKDDPTKSLPVLTLERLRNDFVDGDYFVTQLMTLTGTRQELRAEIVKRMRAGALLPHAPTALLRKPFVDLENGEVVAASPWFVRSIERTGIWARYLAAAKTKHDDGKGAEEWSAAFGAMLEDWCREYAKRAERAASTSMRVLLPTHPGAQDEIEDVVTVENEGAAFFSVKARLVREDIARHAISRTKLLDWYEQYFFAAKTERFRPGVIAQLSSRIDMLRAGKFEPQLSRDARVYPVLVTFDNLCDNQMLSDWLSRRCKDHGLLQQSDVGALTIAVIDDYERLMAAPSQGKSLATLLASRGTPRFANERLDVVLYGHQVESRLPGTDAEYQALTDRVVDDLRAHSEARRMR